jgi:hypothetical protein
MSITMDEEIKRWTARRKSALVLEIKSWLRLFGQLPAGFKWISAGVC